MIQPVQTAVQRDCRLVLSCLARQLVRPPDRDVRRHREQDADPSDQAPGYRVEEVTAVDAGTSGLTLTEA